MIEDDHQRRHRLPPVVYDLGLRLGANPEMNRSIAQLKQTERPKQKIEAASWISLTATQTISTRECAFDWRARAGPFGVISARDALKDGEGRFDMVALGHALSLSGNLAMRAAAFEPRVKCVVAYDVMLEFFQCTVSRRGKLVEFALKALVSFRLGSLPDLMGFLMKRDLYSRWGVEQGIHVTAASSPSEHFFKLKASNCREVSQLITQDALTMAGAEDHFAPLEQFFEQLTLLVNARSVTGQIFTRADQAQSHCQIANFGVALTPPNKTGGQIDMQLHYGQSALVCKAIGERL